MEHTKLPQRLDDKPRFLFWDFDQAMIIFSFLGLGILSGRLLSFLALGVAAAYFFGKYKSGKSKNFLIHAAYWFFPGNFLGLKTIPKSEDSEWVG